MTRARVAMEEQPEKGKSGLNYDCHRVRKLLALFGHSYTKKEMKRMKDSGSPLYQKVLEYVNVFSPKISCGTPIWRVFLLSGGAVKPLSSHPTLRVAEDKSISIEMIQKLSGRVLPKISRDADDRRKLYHLVSGGHLECSDKNEKSISSCIMMDHSTEMAQFARDKHGIKRMTKKLGNVVNYQGNIRKGVMTGKGERISYMTKRIEQFMKEVTQLIREEGKFSHLSKHKKVRARNKANKEKDVSVSVIEKEEKDPILTEISVDEAAQLLGQLV